LIEEHAKNRRDERDDPSIAFTSRHANLDLRLDPVVDRHRDPPRARRWNFHRDVSHPAGLPHSHHSQHSHPRLNATAKGGGDHSEEEEGREEEREKEIETVILPYA